MRPPSGYMEYFPHDYAECFPHDNELARYHANSAGTSSQVYTQKVMIGVG